MSTSKLENEWLNLSLDVLRRFAELELMLHQFPEELSYVQKYISGRVTI